MNYRLIYYLLFFLSYGITEAQNLPSGTTESGLNYTFLRKGDGLELDSGMIALVSLRQTVIDGNDTLFNKGGNELAPLLLKNPIDPIMEGFLMMAVGDSAILSCNVLAVFPTPPRGLTPTSTLIYHVSVAKAFEDEAGYQEYLQSLEEERLAKEAQVILDYLEKKGLEGKKTESGLYYVVLEEGTGELPSQGDRLSVHYTGTLLDGTKFDSSKDRKAPFEFEVGKGRVIQGWDEGFQLFKQGGKGLLIIPSNLAYGARNMGVIKPFSILCFEIELLENKGQ